MHVCKRLSLPSLERVHFGVEPGVLGILCLGGPTYSLDSRFPFCLCHGCEAVLSTALQPPPAPPPPFTSAQRPLLVRGWGACASVQNPSILLKEDNGRLQAVRLQAATASLIYVHLASL